MSEQPTPLNEYYHVFLDVDWKEYPIYGYACKKYKIYLTIYDSKYGGQNAEIKELEEFYQII